MKVTEKTLFTLLLLVSTLLILYLTLDLGRIARMVPLTVIIPTLALLFMQLLFDLFHSSDQRRPKPETNPAFRNRGYDDRKEDSKNVPVVKGTEVGIRPQKEVAAFVWMLSLIAFIYLCGLLIAAPIYAFLYLKMRSKIGWFASVLSSIGVGCCLTFLFGVVLEFQLYQGKLWEWLCT